MNSTTKGQAMNPPSTRIFTPSRVVALALIAVLACGLGYLRFAPGPGAASVPEGAQERSAIDAILIPEHTRDAAHD